MLGVLCCINLRLIAQIITIGSGNSNTSLFPTNSISNYSYTQQIYTAAELTQSGVICGISFYSTSSDTISRTLKVYLGQTDQISFLSGSNWIPENALTQVFAGSISIGNEIWNFIPFDIPFVYNGIQNLVIAIDDNTQIIENQTTFKYTLTPNKALFYNSTTNNPTVTSPPNGTVSNNRNNLKIHFCSPTVMTGVPLSSCDFLYSDPGGMNNYSGNLNITQTITASTLTNTRLVLDFLELSIGEGDTLWLYDGPSSLSPFIGYFTNINYPFQFTASGTSFTFTFNTDTVQYSSGWLAHIYCTYCDPVTILNGSPCQPNTQHSTGYAAIPFCTDINPYGVTFPSATSGNGEVYLDAPLGCLYTAPRPAWYFMQINTPGNMLINIIQTSNTGSGIDVDFACWGPFFAFNQSDFLERLCCGDYDLYAESGISHRPPNGIHTNEMGGYPINNLIDCSYEMDNTEWCYIPNAQVNQFYILLITNFNGGQGTISFNTVAPYTTATTDCSLLAQVSNNGPLCAGSSLQLICNNPQPNATYLWTGPNGFTSTLPNPLISNITLANSGVYTLQITVNNVVSQPASTTVIVNPNPEITLTSSTPVVCMGNSCTLTASGGTSYIWNNNLGNGSSHNVTPNNTTTYMVTGTYYGCKDTASFTVSVVQRPETHITNPNSYYCPNMGTIPISTTTTGGGGTYTYQWWGAGITNQNSNNSIITVNPDNCNTQYTAIVIAFDQYGCFDKDTARYMIKDTLPPFIANYPFSIQTATGSFPNYTVPNFSTLVFSNCIDNCFPNSQLTYSQIPEAGSTISNQTYVQVTVSDPCGNSKTIMIRLILPVYGSVTNIINVNCNGEENGSATVNVNGGIPPYTIQWITSPIQNGTIATQLSEGNYHVNITDSLGNFTTTFFTITEPSALILESHITNNYCQSDGGSFQINVTGGTSPYHFLWNTGDTTNSITNLISDSYSCTVTDNNGCIQTLSDTVIANQGLFINSFLSNTETCNQTNGSILLDIYDGTPPFTYYWENENESGSMLNNLESGYYFITVTDLNSCTDTVSVYVDLFDIQSSIEINKPSICGQNNGSLLLKIEGGSGNYNINWYEINNFLDRFAFNISPGSYFVTVQDQECIDTIHFIIQEINKPIACFEFPNSSGVLINQSFLLQNCSQFATDYLWNFGDGTTSSYTNPSHLYGESGTKWVTLIAHNEYDCVDSITRSIVVHEISSLFIPNSFTPNGDGLNDVFIPVCYFVNENGFSMKIFNRWGQQIFTSYHKDEGWNGKIGTIAAPQGSYSYIIIYENIFGQPFRKTGVIQLIK
ncbi:MAG: hypothetical protein H6Q25_1391 [Bacteroidetes bacterium]|nr:hypothetical protein [Bacteroidota bacterium]